MRSAAAIRCPCHSSTAPAIPVAVDARTTAGGGTRSGARTSTTRCASGRNTCSQSASLPRRGLRERASALDKLCPLDRLPGLDPLARVVNLPPGVPEEEAARVLVRVDVGDDPLSKRSLPPLHRAEARIDLADRFVAEIEEIRVEEGDVVVHLVGTGHVRAHDLPVRVRVILVLDAEAPPEDRAREACRVARGEDVVTIADAAVLV